MLGEALTRIQQFLMLIWYFLIDRAALEAVEEKLRTMPETQAQRMRRRWERSRERARRTE